MNTVATLGPGAPCSAGKGADSLEFAGKECLQIRVHGDASLPVLVYLPGIHGDWTLIPSFRAAVAGRVRFVEFIYPRTLEWSLVDYARAVAEALNRQGVRRGWLLGESFGSQLVWPLLDTDVAAGFQINGVILAGGFVRYPLIPMVKLAERICAGTSLAMLRRVLGTYARFARFRHRNAPETMASIGEFVERRTDLDKRAAQHRLRLLCHSDPREAARGLRLPLWHLTGAWDPIVPWVLVRPWLARFCPGYRGGRVLWSADHNVLSTAPRAAADTVMGWIASSSGSA